MKATVIRAGTDPNDPNAARVVSEYLDGTFHTEEVLPPGADVEAAMKATLRCCTVPVRSVRAMRGSVEVARWSPNFWQRLKWAWSRRATPPSE